MEYDIKKTLRRTEREMFRSDLPLWFIGRFEDEYSIADSSGLADDIELLLLLNSAADEAGCEIDERLAGSGSHIKFFLEASAVDPLPPHYYCSECYKMELMPEIVDGFDLPEKYCCGRRMKRTGHSIPFEHYRYAYADQAHDLVLSTSKSFAPKAVQLIKDHYKLRKGIRAVPVRRKPEERSLQLVLLSCESWPHLDSDGFMSCNEAELYENDDLRHIYIYLCDTKERIAEFRKKTGLIPKTDELLEKPVLSATEMAILKRLSDDGRRQLIGKELSFSSLLEMHGYERSTYADDNPVLLDRDSAYSELFLWREQVWDVVMEKIRPELQIGPGFADRIMTDVRKGRFACEVAAHRAPENVVEHLRELGIDEHWITQMKYTFYLPCKADLINTLLDDLKIAWYELQEQKH